MIDWRGYQVYPSVDPDFDEMGGEITIEQLISLVPQVYERPYAKQQARKAIARIHEEAWQKRYEKAVEATEEITLEITIMRDQFRRVTDRYQRALRNLNPRCNRCIPYNGSYTPNYWNTGQRDPW
jgi:hypothetical protein